MLADNLAMKPLEEMTFTDDFMFGWVIRHDAELCREILQCLLGIKINKIEYLETQKKEEPSSVSKSVFLDVYADDGRIFDVEMQTARHPGLLKRARYYLAAIDTAQLGTGIDYTALKDTYVIFICTFDPFGENRAVYEVKRSFAHENHASADNGTHELYFNAKAYSTVHDVDLSSFLRYTMCGEVATPLTRQIEKSVETQKKREACKAMYTMLDMARMDGRIEGRTEGRTEGIAWQKAQSVAQIERMARDMERINSDNARLMAEIASLKAAARPSAQ